MKDSYIRFRCTEGEKEIIELLALADPYSNSVTEYILGLIKEDLKNYEAITIDAVVYGLTKETLQTIEKRRAAAIGTAMVDSSGRISAKAYLDIWKKAEAEIGQTASRPNHYMVLEANGKKLKHPGAMADYVTFE